LSLQLIATKLPVSIVVRRRLLKMIRFSRLLAQIEYFIIKTVLATNCCKFTHMAN